MKESCWNCKFNSLCYAYNSINEIIKHSPYLGAEAFNGNLYQAIGKACTQYQENKD